MRWDWSYPWAGGANRLSTSQAVPPGLTAHAWIRDRTTSGSVWQMSHTTLPSPPLPPLAQAEGDTPQIRPATTITRAHRTPVS